MHPESSSLKQSNCNVSFSYSSRSKCIWITYIIPLIKPAVITLTVSPPVFHPRSLITISRLAARPPVCPCPQHRQPRLCPLLHTARLHPLSTSCAAPPAPAGPACCMTMMPPAARSSHYWQMRWAFITLHFTFQMAHMSQ